MTDTLPEPPDVDPAGLAGTNFSRARRGFEPSEVHAALGRAADALRAWKLRDAHLHSRLEDLEERLSDAQRVDETRLTEVLGEETTRIIAAARDAAHEIRTNADERAARVLQETADEANSAAEAMKGEAAALRDEAARVRDEAVAEATRVRSEAEAAAEAADVEARARHEELLSEAEGVLALRTAEAEEVAAGITEAAAAQLESARVEAEQLRTEVRAESAAILEAAREEGRTMVAEAKAVRERILSDLVQRRATARRQIEGARAGRDRIVEVLRSTIEDVTSTIEGLGRAEEVAGAAAAEAAGSVLVDAEAEMAELLVELGEDADVAADAAAGTVVAPGAGAFEVTEGESDAADSAEVEPEPGSEASQAAEELAAAHATDGTDGRADDHADHADDDESDEAPGATVHDLFARIRAEGLDEDDEDAAQDDAAADVERGDVATAEGRSDAPETDAVEDAGGDQASEVPGDGAEELAAAVGGDGIDLTVAPTPGPTEGAQVSVMSATGGSGDGVAAGQGAVATLETPTQLLDRRDQLLGPVEKSLSRALRRLASDEQNELLDQLRRIKRGRPDPEALLPRDGEVAVARFVDVLEPEFARAADAGAAFWAEVSGTSAGSLFGDDELLRERLAQRVAGFLDLHRAHMERTFADAEAEGLDVSELSDRVRAAYRDWRSGSLADLAGDLATAGFTHGERRAAGPGTPWRWVVDNGGLPCADGEDNALAGAVPCEEPFPTGDVTPPAHPGCRCILAPAHQ